MEEKKYTLQTFLEAAGSMQGYLVASLTDEYIVDTWPETYRTLEGKEGKLLEARAFNDKKEVQLFRSDLTDSFSLRIRDDTGLVKNKDYYDEDQYLDIDTERSSNLFGTKHEVRTTTSGTYVLPLGGYSNKTAVRIRYYWGAYERTGQAYVKDWRPVGFEEA